ncbi:ribonuclease Z, mitochondrial [Toxorhynchites rutilus septentrionalis]|uniref:ribonuclease Z, mitochondrial n=1 Tax=Toxorhynchites rutilus septentrionalis TaxID=329112 RepID=UPI00247AB846|nr:ribonuclease Z, mitochondrial [Toxorhynchites rutilus septentrionalis]
MHKFLLRTQPNVVCGTLLRLYSSLPKYRKILAEMPLDPKHIAEAQKQRLKLKQKVIKVSPGIVNLQIVGSGAPGSPASVYLFSDQTRYLFNCGEGTQRLAYEHKTKLSCLENIFMTRTCWDRIGGLPGICLTMQDVGVPNVTLHGPPGLDELFRAMRRFVILKDMKVDAAKCEPSDVFEDHVMTLKYVRIKREPQSVSSSEDDEITVETTFDNTDYYAHELGKRPRLAQQQHQDWTKRQEESVMAYICKLKLRFGQLSLEKCVDRGVPPGPLLGQLKNGNDVTLPNGSVVKSSDVRGPNDPGPVFIFLDIPCEAYLKDLEEKNSHFEPYQSTASEDSNQAMYVLHFSTLEVMRTAEYKKFMDKFSPSTRHIALNEINRFSGYVACHRIQYHLNQLDSQIFPLLREQNNDYNTPENGLKGCDLVRISSLSYLHIRPRKGIERTLEATLNPSEYLQELDALPDFKSALDDLRKKLAAHKTLRACSEVSRMEKFPRVVFLGTGSSIPNKTRNVSAILVHTAPDSSILLDCGEGTAGQIVRLYGQDRAEQVFRSLKAIYISHLHADHHLGLFGLLLMRRRLLGANSEKVLLLAPEQISYWLKLYDCRFELLHREYILVKNADLIESPLRNERILELGVTEIATCRVRHCPHSFGVALRMPSREKGELGEEVKITYSGDTMPCQDLVDLGRDSTILIHESTMEDELEAEARVKMHSTLSQAIEQGKKMNAKFTLLTHFSQRYAKIPRIESELETNLGIAFDNMEVTIDDLPQLSLFYPALKAMFISHYEEMEQKAIKRGNKKLRLEGGSGTNSKETSPNR